MNSLELTPLYHSDKDDLFDLVDRNRDRLSKFNWEVSTRTPSDSGYFIEKVLAIERTNGAPTRAMRVDGSLAGIMAMHPIDYDTKSAALGFWIDKDQTGRGYVSAAVNHMVDMAFSEYRLERLRIDADASNVESRAVAEKVGFQLTGIDTYAPWKPSRASSTMIAHYALTADAMPLANVS